MFSKKFISATAEYCTYEKHINAPLLRKTFENDELASAKLTVTSSGFYEAYFNGERITASPLSPYITNPDRMLFYDEYDLTPMLKKGKNAFGFMLGNGMVNCLGGFIWSLDKSDYRSAPSVAFALETVDKDGNKNIIEADTTVKTHPSHITFDDLRSGVHADGRLIINGWCEPEFDDSAWCNALPAQTMRGEGVIKTGEGLTFARTLKPVSIEKGYSVPRMYEDINAKTGIAREISKVAQYQPGGEREDGFIYSFPENLAFVPTLKIKGRPGQVIVLQFAEFKDGNTVSWENIDRFYPYGYTQRDIYICSGKGEETFTPPFTYHSAQYCLVMGIDEEQATEDLLTFNVLHSDLQSRGGFSCSSETANKLQACTRRSDLSNFIYFPIDCPHREKNGWTGDASVSAEQMTLNFATENSLKQWMRLIRAHQRVDGAIPGIIPTDSWGYEYWNGPVWDSVIVEIPYRLYQYRGDLSCFKENADMIFRYLYKLTDYRDKRGLIDYGLGDYVQAGHGGGSPSCPKIVTSTVLAKYICEKAELLYNACGMTAQAEFAQTLKNEFLSAIRAHLINATTATMYGNCQCAQAIGIFYDIFEDGQKDRAYRVLLDMIDNADGHLDCGVLGVRTLFHVLAKGGNAELAWNMITRSDAPSYGIWVDKFGLTALAESFHCETYYRLPSLNHHFLGDISNFFISEIAGLHINPDGSDCASIEIRPAFVNELSFAEAYYETPFGKASVRWDKTDAGYTISVEAPKEVHCSLVVPDGYMIDDKQNGWSFVYDFSGTVNIIPYAPFAKGKF